MPKTKLDSEDAYRLLLEGQEALSQIEANGIRVDESYLDRMLEETQTLLDKKTEELKQGEIWDHWLKAYGDKANLDSGDQLGHIIFDVMGVPCEKRTPTGKPKTDEEALERVKFPWVQQLVTRNKLFTARNTFLLGIRRELVDGILHPMFSLNTTISFRSSSSYPNSQNWPNRIDRTARLVRSAIIPRSDEYVLVEFDLKGAEVCVSECYHQDPRMMEYILQGYDYHKELAMQCYQLERDQVTKLVRGTAKAGFVFASFYGSWYISIAESMWNAIDQDDLKRTDGVSLKDHLASKGIHRLGDLGKTPVPGTFEAHIKSVYDDFWGVRFPVYAQWKVDWFQEYLKNGYCHSLTGFTYQGIAERNEIINYPIQGSSFHCLLWSLIRINKWLRRYKMRSMIVGQIHDSIIMDVHRSELDDVLAYSGRTMVRDIREEWPWIIVRLDVEAAKCERCLYEKTEVKLAI